MAWFFDLLNVRYLKKSCPCSLEDFFWETPLFTPDTSCVLQKMPNIFNKQQFFAQKKFLAHEQLSDEKLQRRKDWPKFGQSKHLPEQIEDHSQKNKNLKRYPRSTLFQSMSMCDSVETNLLLVEFHIRLEFGRLVLIFTFLKIFESIQLSHDNLAEKMEIFELCLF